MARRKASPKQIAYIKRLCQDVGVSRAKGIGEQLLGIDIFEAVTPYPSAPWRKETKLDHLPATDASQLINGLLDVAGREGRRKNNR